MMPTVATPDWMAAMQADRSLTAQRLARHFHESHVPLRAYSAACHQSLGREVLTKARIYLDPRWWMHCRDAHLGRPTSPTHAEIFGLLCSLVDSGKAICPIALPALAETWRQSEFMHKSAAAQVVDRLSQNISLRSRETLAIQELELAMRRLLAPHAAVVPNRSSGWTRVGWMLDQKPVTKSDLDTSQRIAVEKMQFDILASVRFSRVVTSPQCDEFLRGHRGPAFYRRLISGALDRARGKCSYSDLYQSELRGWLRASGRELTIALHRYQRSLRTRRIQSKSRNVIDSCPDLRTVTQQLLETMADDQFAAQLPTAHVVAGSHAAKRLRGEPYRRGDLLDHHHASLALGYCDVFLAGNDLGKLLTTPPLQYDHLFGCEVLWEPDAVVECLRSLARQGAKCSDVAG